MMESPNDAAQSVGVIQKWEKLFAYWTEIRHHDSISDDLKSIKKTGQTFLHFFSVFKSVLRSMLSLVT